MQTLARDTLFSLYKHLNVADIRRVARVAMQFRDDVNKSDIWKHLLKSQFPDLTDEVIQQFGMTKQQIVVRLAQLNKTHREAIDAAPLKEITETWQLAAVLGNWSILERELTTLQSQSQSQDDYVVENEHELTDLEYERAQLQKLPLGMEGLDPFTLAAFGGHFELCPQLAEFYDYDYTRNKQILMLAGHFSSKTFVEYVKNGKLPLYDILGEHAYHTLQFCLDVKLIDLFDWYYDKLEVTNGPESKDSENISIMHLAAGCNSWEVFQRYVDESLLDSHDSIGETIAFSAIRFDHYDFVERCVEKYGNRILMATNKSGKSLQEHCSESTDEQTQAFLTFCSERLEVKM